MSDPVLEIHDTELDQEGIRQRVQDKVRRREAAGGYGPDPGRLGRSSRPSQEERSPAGLARVRQAMGEMAGRASLRPYVFASHVPVLGGLVVAVRNAWSWVAARWIGQHLIEQQSAFNEAVVGFGSEAVEWQGAIGERLGELEDRVRELEVRLERTGGDAHDGTADEERTP
jgi:hypothetical protein